MSRKPKPTSSSGPVTQAAQRAEKLMQHLRESEERLVGGTAVATLSTHLSFGIAGMLTQRREAARSGKLLARNSEGRAQLKKHALRLLKAGEEPRSLVKALRANFPDYEECSSTRIRTVLQEESVLKKRKRK